MSNKKQPNPVRPRKQRGASDDQTRRSNRVTRVRPFVDADMVPYVIVEVDGGMVKVKVPAGNAFAMQLDLLDALADLADRPDSLWNLVGSGIPPHQVEALRRRRYVP